MRKDVTDDVDEKEAEEQNAKCKKNELQKNETQKEHRCRSNEHIHVHLRAVLLERAHRHIQERIRVQEE